MQVNYFKKLIARKNSVTTHHRSILKSISAVAGGNLAGSLLGAIGGILVARFVDPEVNGQFRVFTIPLMYLTFLHLGTFDGLHRQIPFNIGHDRPDHVERIASATGAWNLFVTFVVATGFIFLAIWGLVHDNRLDAAGWLSQAFVCTGIYYGGYLGATFRTLNNFVVFARVQLFQAIIAFLFVFSVAFWGFYGLCLRAAIPTIIGVWLYQRARPLRMPLHFNYAAFKEVVKIGMPFCFWGTLDTSLWLAAEYSLMLKFGGVVGVGLFSVAVVMRESLSILPQSVQLVLMPRVVESYARQGRVLEATKRSLQAAGALTVMMVVVVMAISYMLNYFVPAFIPNYTDGLTLMKVCLWLAVIQAARLPLNGLFATGKVWLYGRGVLAGILIFPLAVFLLNPLIGGVLAVAVGSLIGRLVRTVVAYLDLYVLMRQET